MTHSRIRPRFKSARGLRLLRGGVPFCALFLIAAAGPLHAQEAPQRGPMQLIPPDLAPPPPMEEGQAGPGAGEAAPAGPRLLYPSGRAPVPSAEGPRTIAPRPGGGESGIEMGVLGQVEESSIGLLGDGNGGLGALMWAGTNRLDAERLLPELPGATRETVLDDLQRRLLLTTAAPPSGATGGESLLYLRLERLMAAGDGAALRQLLADQPSEDMNAGAAKLRAEAFLAAGDVRGACLSLAALPVGGDPLGNPLAAFSMQLTALCQADADNAIAANLSADLAREQGLEAPLFYALLAQKTDGLKLDAPAPEKLTPLLYALYLSAERKLPENAGAIAAPAVLADMMNRQEAPLAARIEAGERALALNLAAPSELAALYGDAKLPAKAETGWAARAALFQKAAAESVTASQAALISEALTSMEEEVGFAAGARLYAPLMASIPPNGADPVLGAQFVRAFAVNQDRVRASMWLNTLTEAGHKRPELDELKGVVRLLEGQRGQPADMEAATSQLHLRISEGGAARAVAAREAMLLDALGYPLPTEIWTRLLDGGELPDGLMPPPQTMRALERAAQEGRRGETVLLALVITSEAGLAGVHPQALASIVSGLGRVGLKEEAHRIAIEALLAVSGAGLQSRS